MHFIQTLPISENLQQVLVIIVALIILWTILRFVLRLTIKLFLSGCGVIFLFGLCLLIYRAITAF